LLPRKVCQQLRLHGENYETIKGIPSKKVRDKMNNNKAPMELLNIIAKAVSFFKEIQGEFEGPATRPPLKILWPN
jgi:hypothetical protein